MQGVYELHMWTNALLQPPICKSFINLLPHNKQVVFLECYDTYLKNLVIFIDIWGMLGFF
jgi:hypothetical protein